MMSNSDALTIVIVFGACLGALLLVALLVRVRRALGWRVGLPAILTDGLIAFAGAVVVLGGVSLSRVLGGLSGPHGALIARALSLGTTFTVVWFGVIRLLRWLFFSDGTEAARQQDRLSMDDEIVRLRVLLDRYLRDDGATRQGGIPD